MAEEIVANAAESLVSQTWQKIQCLLNYNINITKLKDKVKDLEVRIQTVQLSVDDATHKDETIAPDVLHWQNKAENFKQEVNKFLEHTTDIEWGCLYCTCPKPHSRYRLSKQALDWTNKVIGLQDESKFERYGYPAKREQMSFTSPGEFDGFKSRMKILDDVMEAVVDDSVTIIGICGMPGVGKTTLVKEIADKVTVAKLFDEVAWAVVSNDAVVAKVQDQLAESLNMKIEEKTDRGRAERLHKRLSNKDKRILVILDDLWKKLDLHDMGIPVGVKVLLTSRFFGVCSNMKAKPFQVDVLSEEESWHLFKKSAEISDEANEIKDIAKQLAKECKQLPLAIVIVGSALKNKEDYAWRDALRELKESSGSNFPDMEEFVFSRIKLSYNYLKDDSKFLLLLCSLFPEDFEIALEDLVKYAKGLQSSYLFKDVKTIAQVRDRICTITDELKRCYLLLEGDAEKCVKLHDVVRAACLTIDFTGERLHTVKHDGLKEWPQEDSCASSTAISLTFGEMDQIFSTLEYPKLELLRMNFEEHKLHMHEDFFERMKEVKVLDLCYLNSKLPSSLQSLVNLRTLSLDCCKLHGDLSVIGRQKELEILSFYNSSLEHFPNKISELSKLKSLDLRFKKGPPLPPGILVRLEKLEELYLGSTFKGWKRKEDEAYSMIIIEISSLLNLHTIEFRAYDSYCLEQVLEKLHHPEKLMRFKISNKIHRVKAGHYQFGKVLNFRDIEADFLKMNATQCLLQKTEYLRLKEIKGLTNLVSELDENGFVNLKTLKLAGCCDLRYLVDATSFNTSGGGRRAFINLETLFINRVANLETLCHGNLPLGSFARLRKLELESLPSLRSCGLVRSLLQLQEITINECIKLETIVSNNKEGEKNYVEFPKLTYLNLSYLDSFLSFVPESTAAALLEKVMLPNLETLDITELNGIRCVVDGQMPIWSLSKLQSIRIFDCDGLVYVVAFANSMKLLQNLQQLVVKRCESVEVVFDFTSLIVEGEESFDNPLAQLESLDLSELRELKHMCRMLPKGVHAFKRLKLLKVISCPSLRYLLSPSMAEMLVALEGLHVEACDQMEAIIGVDEREFTENESTEDIVVKKEGKENTNKLEFPKLKWIQIDRLHNLRMLCSENVELELPLLTKVVIRECPIMTKFCDGRLIATSLSNVVVTSYVGYEIKTIALDEFSSWLKECELRIRCIYCSYAKSKSCNHLD